LGRTPNQEEKKVSSTEKGSQREGRKRDERRKTHEFSSFSIAPAISFVTVSTTDMSGRGRKEKGLGVSQGRERKKEKTRKGRGSRPAPSSYFAPGSPADQERWISQREEE